jgi:ElaB/YqjD/DUF883 family membrane-anchored ribosome-binding protein
MQTTNHAETEIPEKVRPDSDRVVTAGNRLASDIRVLVSDAEELLKSTATYSGEGINAARVKFRATLESFKERVVDAQSAAVGKVKETVKATDGYVRENPWKMVGVAAAIGLVVGVLLQRK